MSDPKSLKFQFVVDEASLQKTRQLIRELTADLLKLNEAAGKAGGLSGLGGGGGGGGVSVGSGQKSPEQQRVIAKTAPVGRGLVTNLLDQKNALKGIADGSKESMQAMSRDLRQAVQDQIQHINRLKSAVDALQASYGRVKEAARPAVLDKIGELNGRIQSGQAAHDQLVEAGRGAGLLPPPLPPGGRRNSNELMPEIPYPNPGPPITLPPDPKSWWQRRFGGGGSIWDSDKGVGENLFANRKMPGWAGTAMRAGGIVLAGANSIINETAAANAMYTNLAGERGSIAGNHIQRLAGGDIKGLMAIQALRGEQRDEFMEGAFGSTATAQAIMKGGKETLTTTVGMGDKALGQGWTSTGMSNQGAMNALKIQQQAESARVMENLATDKFMGELSQRIQFQRMTGAGGLGGGRNGSDPFAGLQTSLMNNGYSIGEYLGALGGLRGSAGSRFAGKNAYTAMAANAEGLGGFAELMGASARSGGGMDFARGAIGGGIDRWAGVQLGQTIVGSGFDPRGTTSGMGVLAAAQAGMGFDGSAGDFNRVNRLGLGLQAGDAIVGGGMDAYQQGRNLVGAINRLGPGASTYSQDFLANGMSMKQMIDISSGHAKGTDVALRAKALLGNDYQNIIKGQLGESVNSVTDRFVDQGGSDSLSTAMRKFRASGSSDIMKFASKKGNLSKEERTALAGYYGDETGVGFEGGMGLFGLGSGLGNKSVKKGGVGGRVGDTEKKALESQAQIADELNKVMLNIKSGMEQALKDAPKSMEKMATWNATLSANAEKFVAALGIMGDAITDFNKRMGYDKPTQDTKQKKYSDLSTQRTESSAASVGPKF